VAPGAGAARSSAGASGADGAGRVTAGASGGAAAAASGKSGTEAAMATANLPRWVMAAMLSAQGAACNRRRSGREDRAQEECGPATGRAVLRGLRDRI